MYCLAAIGNSIGLAIAKWLGNSVLTLPKLIAKHTPAGQNPSQPEITQYDHVKLIYVFGELQQAAGLKVQIYEYFEITLE